MTLKRNFKMAVLLLNNIIASNFNVERKFSNIFSMVVSQFNEFLPQPVSITCDEDDDYCLKLYENYLNDPDPDKHEAISLSDYAKELGILLR